MSESTDERLPNFDVLTRLPEGRGTWKRRARYFVLLLGLIFCVCWITVMQASWPALPQNLGQRGHMLDALQQYLSMIALAGLFVASQFFVLGCFLYGIYHLHKKKSADDTFSIRRWPVASVGLCLTAVLSGMPSGQLPSLVALVLPCSGLMLGVWVASNCFRGLRTTMWLVPKLAALAIVVAGLVGSACYLATSDEPSAFESLSVSAEDKARLAKLIESREYLDYGQQRLQLSERDVNLLMAAACEQLSIDAKAKAQLRGGAVGLDVSLGTPLGRYINLDGNYQLAIQGGDVKFRPNRLAVGRLTVPSILHGSLGDCAVAVAKADTRADAVISSIDRLLFTDQQVEAVYHAENLRHELKLAFHDHLGETQDVLAATSVHARHLVNAAADLPTGDEQFLAFLQSAFTLARIRSRQGRDPVVENRAAVLALAIVLGHARVETFVGDVTDNRLKVKAAWYRGKVAVRRRRDWTRHFFVSAGLALTFNSGVSDGAGLFKEEADSADGGSGFSFSDLLADRAGVRFANAATRDREAAERMQALLANAFSIDDIFPIAADLPEGLRDAEFQQEFGGVDGPGYKEMLAEIERRLDTCRALTK